MDRLSRIKINPAVIFFSIFFLFKLPNIYFFPLFKSSILTTHVLARLLLLILFILNIKQISNLFFKNKIFILVLLLFLLQSFSVLQTVNIISFISRYKEIVVGFLAFSIALLYRKKSSVLMDLLILTTLFNVAIQILFIIYPNFVNSVFNFLLYDKVYDLVVINFARSRTYFETFDEIAIPVILYTLLVERRKGQKIALSFLFLLLIFVSITSGWRTRLVMLMFGAVTSVILFKKNRVRYIVFLFLAFSSLIFLFNSLYNTNVFTRFDLNEENTLSLKSRTDQLGEAFTIMKQMPFGVGLGNYYDYIPSYIKNRSYLVSGRLQQQEGLLAEENVHNIFGQLGVEAGFPAIIIFMALLFLFAKNDYNLIKLKDYPKITFMIGFWIMFIYSLFNPLIPGVANYLFWFLRGYSLREIRSE